MRRLVFAVSFTLLACSSGNEPGSGTPSSEQAVRLQPDAGVRLTRTGPAPQEWVYQPPPADVREVNYPAESGRLLAWFWIPENPLAEGAPVVVYLHGGFAFSVEDFEVTRPFREAGYAVMTPTVRGENGNPGHFELFLGEVDDVESAIKWVREQPGIDRDHVYVFGHSVGGALASLAALRPIGLRAAGAAVGLYSDETFEAWGELVPFDASDVQERRRRLFLPRLSELHSPFHLYLADEESPVATVDRLHALAAEHRVALSVELLHGSHHSVLPDAMDLFLARIEADRIQSQSE